MARLSRTFVLSPALLAALTLVACDGGDDMDIDGAGSDSASIAVPSDFDDSQLPGDFPRNLIPPAFDIGNFVALGSVETASFESDAPVGDAIEHYTNLLGAPRVDSESANGNRTAQWDVAPWTLSVIGSASETIIGVSRTSE